MNLLEAAIMGAAYTIVFIYFIGEKIIKVDFSGLLKRNWKSTKCKKMLAQWKGPWQGTNLQSEIRSAFNMVLLPLEKADKGLLPARMDMTFRRRIEQQIGLLERQKLCREIRLIDVVPLPKNSFRHWNDDGREWRESVLQCSALERLLPKEGGSPVHVVYRKNAYLRLLQSRHIRNCDRKEKRESYYANQTTINCPSCGAEVKLRTSCCVCYSCSSGVLCSMSACSFASGSSRTPRFPWRRGWGLQFLFWLRQSLFSPSRTESKKNWRKRLCATPKIICVPASTRHCIRMETTPI